MRDLSREGCKIDTIGFSMEAGNRVLIRPEGFESMLGTVIWISDGLAGVKFDDALTQEAVENFCLIFPETDTSVMLDIAA